MAILPRDEAYNKSLLLHANPCISFPCFPRPPVTSTGVYEAEREKVQGKLDKQGCHTCLTSATQLCHTDDFLQCLQRNSRKEQSVIIQGGIKKPQSIPKRYTYTCSVWNHTNVYFYGLPIYKRLNPFHCTSSVWSHKRNAFQSLRLHQCCGSATLAIAWVSGWAAGSSGTRQAAEFSQHLLWSDSWGTHYSLLKDLCLQILRVWYTATYRKGN